MHEHGALPPVPISHCLKMPPHPPVMVSSLTYFQVRQLPREGCKLLAANTHGSWEVRDSGSRGSERGRHNYYTNQRLRPEVAASGT